MLAEARDVMGILAYEQQLGKLREEFLTLSAGGALPGPDFLKAGEARILAELRREFYTRSARLMVKPGQADSVSDEEDFKGRTQKLSESVILRTHQMLASIPFHGQVEYRET